MTAEKFNGANTSVGYDASDEVTSFGAESYGFDASGNRNSAGYSVGAGNRVSTDGVWTYTYDSEGQRTKKSKGAGAETWAFGYDTRGQMLWAEKRATDGGALQWRQEYGYDAQGDRVRTTTFDGTTTVTYRTAFGPDGEAWADVDTGNALVDQYVRAPGEELPVARRNALGASAWLHGDRLGSLRLVTDGAGALKDLLSYTAFGKASSETDASWGGRFKWTGQEAEATLGQQRHGWRWYDLETGTWTTRDPVGFGAGDYNLTRYVGNNSANLVDPSGLIALTAAQRTLLRQAYEQLNAGEKKAYDNLVARTRSNSKAREAVQSVEYQASRWGAKDPLAVPHILREMRYGIQRSAPEFDAAVKRHALQTRMYHEGVAAALRREAEERALKRDQEEMKRLEAEREGPGAPRVSVWRGLLFALAPMKPAAHASGQIAGGAAQLGAAYALAHVPGAQPLAGALIIRSVDSMWAGVRTLVAGEPQETYAHMAFQAALAETELLSNDQAHLAATGLEIGLDLVLDWQAGKAAERAARLGAGQFRNLQEVAEFAAFPEATRRGLIETAIAEGKLAQKQARALEVLARMEERKETAEALRELAGEAARVGNKELESAYKALAEEARKDGVKGVQAMLKRHGPQRAGKTALSLLRSGPSCFVAGTPILTPGGPRPVESLRPGDLVLSRSEHDPEGQVEARRVVENYVRSALLWEVVVGGQAIRTTGEHPFYVAGRGWVGAAFLKAGDRLISHVGTEVLVEGVAETREIATVYNAQVEEFHTYFVGCQEWGFSVWAHNADLYDVLHIGDGRYVLVDTSKPGGTLVRGIDGKPRVFSKAAGEVEAAALSKAAKEAGFEGNKNWFLGNPSQQPAARLQAEALRDLKKTPLRFDPAMVDASLDAAIARRASKPKVFVIGEDQPRVAAAARESNASNAWDFWPREMDFRGRYDPAVHQQASIDFNKHLIKRLAAEGYEFVDAGVDVARAARSPWYQAELDVLKELGKSAKPLPKK